MKQRKIIRAPGIPLMPFTQNSNHNETAIASIHDASRPQAIEGKIPGRDLRLIDVHLIDPNPLAPREVYTAEMISTRAEDLRTQGQHDPIHVIQNPNNPSRFIICDGWTRVQACIQHKVLDQILAEIHYDMTLEASAWFGYEQNEGRSQHTDLDRAMFYAKLHAAGETLTEIARRAKLSKTLMTFYMSYSKLPEEILLVFRDHPHKFSANAAYQLSKLLEHSGIRRTLAVALKFAEGDHPMRWLVNQVQTSIAPPEPRQKKPAAKMIRYNNGVLKQNGDEFELKVSIPLEKHEEFASKLEHLLSAYSIPASMVRDSVLAS